MRVQGVLQLITFTTTDIVIVTLLCGSTKLRVLVYRL